VIDRAVKRLRSLPGITFHATANSLVVPPVASDGFPVALRVLGPRSFLVSYDGWSETFRRAEDAYDCFEFGLSDSCRLRVTLRGETAVAWQIEKREYGLWVPGRVVRRRLVPFWRRRRIERRQNRVFLAGAGGSDLES
jgi:hypothetical protein